MAFAVLDFETTGIHPAQQHRVVEVGIVHVEDDGTVTNRWETLINPQRDLGPQSIHGVRAVEVLDAPLFSDILGDLINVLAGRTLVAHNLSFDLRFLHAEFARAGHPLNDTLPGLCTMQLGNSFGMGGSASLARACGSFGIDVGRAHSAGDDAQATAHLLAAYRHATERDHAWRQVWKQHEHEAKRYAYPRVASAGVVWQRRRMTDEPDPIFLERIAHTVERETTPGADSDYLALLDRCLLDGFISVSEGNELASVAYELGLDREAVARLHARYLVDIGIAAWADGILTGDERTQLVAVGRALHLPADSIEVALAQPLMLAAAAEPEYERFALAPGALVVLTGEMTRMRTEWEEILRRLGYATHPNVTKKVALLAAADPDTLSGKARQARKYGIPIVGEAGLAQLVGIDQ